MNKYQKQKSKLRDFAIEWQRNLTDDNYSMAYFAYWGSYFYKYGKRYGLLKEFRENAIL